MSVRTRAPWTMESVTALSKRMRDFPISHPAKSASLSSMVLSFALARCSARMVPSHAFHPLPCFHPIYKLHSQCDS